MTEKPEIKLSFLGSHALAPTDKSRGVRPAPIYVLTTIGFRENDEPHFRTVGWFPSPEEAVEIVEGNYGDLEEQGYYKYAVIEKQECGLYPTEYIDESVWLEFEATGERADRVVTAKKIPRPERFEGVCNFGLG